MLLDVRDLGTRLPVDEALQEAFHNAQRAREENGWRDSTRLLLLTELTASPSIASVLKTSAHSSEEFRRVMNNLRGPYQYPGSPYSSIQSSNPDVMQVAAQECLRREGRAIGVRDAFIAFMDLQPPPVDRVLRSLRIDGPSLVVSLRESTRPQSGIHSVRLLVAGRPMHEIGSSRIN